MRRRGTHGRGDRSFGAGPHRLRPARARQPPAAAAIPPLLVRALRERRVMRLRSVGLVCVSLVLAGCNAQGEVKREAPPRPVLVAQIHYAPRVGDRLLPGVVKARTESDLGFRVAGKIARRLVDSGAQVKKGEPLAELDDSDLHLQLEQAEADLAAA